MCRTKVNLSPPRTPEKKLKLSLIDRDLEHEDVARGTGLSLSLIKKIASGKKAVVPRTASRIENLLGARIFSTPKQYRDRLNRLARIDVIEFDELPDLEKADEEAVRSPQHNTTIP